MGHQHTIIRSSDKSKRLRTKTSRKHRLKAAHIFLWTYLWNRSRILPDEQYHLSQQAAARHFAIDQSTVSRQLAVLIEKGAIVVIEDTKRGADGFWTSKVIKINAPPNDPHAFLHAEQVAEKTGSASTCKSASLTTVCSTNTNHIENSYTDNSIDIRHYSISDAKTHADQALESEGSRLSAEMYAARIDLGDQIVAAYQGLSEMKNAAASTLAQFGNDGGWGLSIDKQRARIIDLESQRAALTKVPHAR